MFTSLKVIIIFSLLQLYLSSFCDVSDIVNTGHDASELIQKCINDSPVGNTLVLPGGIYSMLNGIYIDKSLTITSNNTSISDGNRCQLGDSSLCVTLLALPDFYCAFGLIRVVGGVENVNIDHIIIDGNRDNRLNSQSANECSNDIGNRNAGRNAIIESCSTCSITNSITTNALCASGFIIVANNLVINNNLIDNNGDHVNHLMWADGITCLQCDNAIVTNNLFNDNTDIDFIMGSGINSHVFNNIYTHNTLNDNKAAFAPIMCDNFNGGTSGDFTNCLIENNKIDCNHGQCCFGIELGPHPWYASSPISGNNFQVVANEISGAGVGINVDAAVIVNNPVNLNSNVISNTPKSFTCGALCMISRNGQFINISPDSTVNYSNNNSPDISTSYACV